MKGRSHSISPSRGPSSIRCIAVLVFVVVMLGTIAVVYTLQGRAKPATRVKSAAEAAEEADAAANEQRVRHHAQRQKLLAEAKTLLRALDAADARIEGAKKVFARFSRDDDGDRNAVSDNNNGPPADGDGENDAPADIVFPIQRYQELRKQHTHLRQYHDAPNRNGTSPVTDGDATIFVGVMSYRQALCAASLSNMFRHAYHSRRVYVGLVEVHNPKDPSCLPEELTSGCQLGHFCINDHVRVRDLEPAESKGLAHGRYLAALLYRGQDYVMLTVMPVFFAPNWDLQLVSAYRAALADAVQRHRRDAAVQPSVSSNLNQPRVVLSTAPESVDPTQSYPALPIDAPPQPPVSTNKDGKTSGMVWERTTMASLCRAEYSQPQGGAGESVAVDASELPQGGNAPRGVPRMTTVLQKERGTPEHQPWVTMKFLFANASLLQDVPLDPHLAFVEREAEEDALYSARLWASGWDAYSPGRTVAFQWKNGDEAASTFANDVPSAQLIAGKRATMMRVQYLLHALQFKSREPLVPDDVVLHEVIVEATQYGVRWGSGSLSTNKEQVTKWDTAALEGRWIPADHRNLDRWYRYAGLNPMAYSAQKQWCHHDK